MVRSIQWLQSIMNTPEQYTVLLAALAGHNKFYDFYQLDKNGKPLPQANPWRHQWWNDLQRMIKLSPSLQLFLDNMGGWPALPTSAEFLR
eukprot:1824871-Heterocapsa_arctica.AAC.1